jgi:hypothetical protein
MKRLIWSVGGISCFFVSWGDLSAGDGEVDCGVTTLVDLSGARADTLVDLRGGRSETLADCSGDDVAPLGLCNKDMEAGSDLCGVGGSLRGGCVEDGVAGSLRGVCVANDC